MSKPSADLDSWPTKAEVAAALRVAEKTVDRLAGRGKLQKATRERPGLPPVAVFHPGDVEREHKARAAANGKAFVMPAGEPESQQAVATRDGHTSTHTSDLSNSARALVAEFFSALAQSPPPAPAPWLTLDEAADYTGLPASILRVLIDEGELPARDVGRRPGGRWRVRRVDLDAIEGVRARRSMTA